MGYGKSRSLASRKREKNVSGAMLENAYQFDKNKVEPFKASWETAIPRKMRQMMHHANLAKEGGPTERRTRHREDTGERRPSKKQRAAGVAQGEGKRGPAPEASASESQPRPKPAEKKKVKKAGQQAFDPEVDPPLPRLQMRQPHQQAGPRPEPARKPSQRKQARTRSDPHKARFGETNDAPPELHIGGVLAKKAAAAAAAQNASSAAADNLARQRAAVLENYKNAKLKRAQAGGD